MVDPYRIVAVRVSYPGAGEQHITHFKPEVGGLIHKIDMISKVKSSPLTYYTLEDGKKAFLELGRTQDGYEYVRSHHDSTPDNNLLNLDHI